MAVTWQPFHVPLSHEPYSPLDHVGPDEHDQGRACSPEEAGPVQSTAMLGWADAKDTVGVIELFGIEEVYQNIRFLLGGIVRPEEGLGLVLERYRRM